jgi:cobalt-zinc-cadmium resistance protein CzcA
MRAHDPIEALVAASVRHRRGVLVGVALLAALGALAIPRLQLDALPDITGNQVLVLTAAPGFTPEEVERRVTRPIELGLSGLPGVERQWSLSRGGISSVTVLFDEETDPFRARQLVDERLAAVRAELPEGVDAPVLGPFSGGLGEVFQLTLTSPAHTPAELLAMLELEVGPVLRAIPGVVEVNTWGGAVRTLDVVLDPMKLSRHQLTVGRVRDTIARAIGSVPGASLEAGQRQVLLRGVSRPNTPSQLASLLVEDVRLGDLAQIQDGMLPRLGAATRDGAGETLYVMLQMQRGANALEVIDRVHARLDDVRAILPPAVELTVVYDRSVLVLRTLRTVFKNLLEGAGLVTLVLFVALGSLRAGLVAALTIPLSMVGAVAGMVFLGLPGNLMSLGAIDFGLLVDGGVVMVEGWAHALTDRADGDADAAEDALVGVARPVFFGVLIILLVYVPILSLAGVDGRLFRPMAITVIFALVTSLVLSLVFVPAALRTFVARRHLPDNEGRISETIRRVYAPALDAALAHPGRASAIAGLVLAGGVALFARAGADFVPQLDEGDMVVQLTLGPDASLPGALDATGRLEAGLRAAVPEVRAVASRVGSPAVATDIMGVEQADVFVALAPREAWRPGLDRAALLAEIEAAAHASVPGADLAFTQPIQMRFNELVGGDTTDVSLSIYGPELPELRRLAEAARDALAAVAGVGDVRINMPPTVPLVEATPSLLGAAQAGFEAGEVLDLVQSLRYGLPVGDVYEGWLRVPVRVKLAAPAGAYNVGAVQVPTPRGELVPLARVATLTEVETPAVVSHARGQRRVVVGFNVRGASLGDTVEAAKAALAPTLRLGGGYHVTWGGQYESYQEAKARLGVTIPLAIGLIVVLLLVMFGRLLPAALIFANVPFAAVGGVVSLTLGGQPISMPSIIGFIALSGIATLNGVVLLSAILAAERLGASPRVAAREAAIARMRPVLITASVAALGFVPMMLATGVGAEVQRPLATVVVGGLVTSTLLTLLLLPTLYARLARQRVLAPEAAAG